MEPSKTVSDNMGAKDGFTTFTKKPREMDWTYAGVLPYESKRIDTFSWEDLRPGKSFYFRVRFWTHEGYTGWSESSTMCRCSRLSLSFPPSLLHHHPPCTILYPTHTTFSVISLYYPMAIL